MTKRQTLIDPSVLTELGKMYTTISQTLRELVQNGFDAYANNVFIEINIPNDYILVKDDGVGMNDYVITNHYANVGMSTKRKEISQFPSIPKDLNSKRPKIGKKGMGKLSWILIAKHQETLTTSMDIDYSIKINFDADNLKEYNEPLHTTKTFKHGTEVKFTNLEISDIKQDDIDEFINTTGFLHNAFTEFNIHLTVKSESTNILNLKIIKTLAEGYEFKTKGTYNYKETKYDSVSDKNVTIREEQIPYDFMFRLPSSNSRNIAEFWLLSGYMGIKKLDNFKGFSGFLNIDNIELVANRNDIQTGEKNKYEKIKYIIEDFLFSQIEKMYSSEKDNLHKKSDVLIYLDGNQESLTTLTYKSENTVQYSRQIGKYFLYDFYGIGFKRLIEFFNSENAIYFYSNETKNKADKASYFGYKCFNIKGWYEEYVVKYSFSTSFVQNINDLPKDAYATSGVTIKPAGNLINILKNASKIFDSLTYSYSKITSKAEKLKKELEKVDELTESEKEEKSKELEGLLKKQKEMKDLLDSGKKQSGETFDDSETEINGKKKHYKKEKQKAFKQSDDHYIEMQFAEYTMKLGFAYFDDENVIANIYMNHYIHLNLNNEYIGSATKEKNPMKQLVLLMPHVCHEISHLWSSDHDEAFQMVNNMLLIPALDNLLKQFPDIYDKSQEIDETEYDIIEDIEKYKQTKEQIEDTIPIEKRIKWKDRPKKTEQIEEYQEDIYRS